ncbi:hypothetical protein JOM56_007810 [Amanita muscaria]
MSDGSRLRQSWYAALNNAEAHFRQLLTSSNWKRLSSEQTRWKSLPDQSNVVVHRRDDVLRLVLDLSIQSDSLEPWKAVLSTPELRQDWDPAVEEAHLIELVDPHVRICKTKFTLGWPANPRDAVTISRMHHDSTTLIDITTSLPRSPDEPAYLRPSPPYVRSHVTLFAWCIQRIHPDSHSPTLRITCFWQHDLKSLWSSSLASPALHQQLSTMVLGLFKSVMKRGTRVPKLLSFGDGIAIERLRYQLDRQALSVDYALVPPETAQQRPMSSVVEYVLPSCEGWDLQLSTKASSDEVEGLQWAVQATKRRETASTDNAFETVVLRVTHEPLRGDHEVLKVRLVIEVSGASRGIRLNGVLQRVHDEIEHIRATDKQVREGEEEILRDVESATGVSIVTTSSAATESSVKSVASGGSASTAVAGSSFTSGIAIVPGRLGERTPAAEKSVLSRVRRNYIYFSSLLQEPEAKWRQTMDARGVSITQLDSIDPTLIVYRAEATFVGVGLWDLYGAVVSAAARGYWDKTHDDAVLLEDVNGLTELWHMKTKPAWPVYGRDAVLLRTVYKSPTSIHVFAFSADVDPHLFPNNQIPPVDPTVIRTQVDLQGWAIESLSPTTTLLTLLEQSDMKGWTGKTSIPSQMIANVAGIGEFAIKCGGPPVVTRLSGARKLEEKFDWERSSFRVVYEALKPAAMKSRSVASSTSTGGSGESTPSKQQQGSEPATNNENEMIECEIRCDLDTWAASLDIVVDPPPQGTSCLRRHKLSAEGGGLWLTLSHDPVYPTATSTSLGHRKRNTKSSLSVGSAAEFLASKTPFNNDEEEEGKFRVIVRRAPGTEKGLVMVNGTRITVDVEEMPENEVKSAMKQKRIKPIRVPLDQPPVVNVVRKRRDEWEGEASPSGRSRTESTSRERSGEVMKAAREWASAPKPAGPLTRLWSYAVEQASVAASTVVPVRSMSSSGGRPESVMPSKQKWPMQYALEALQWVMEEYAEDRLGANMFLAGRSRSISGDGASGSGSSASVAPSASVSSTTPDGWTFVGEKAGLGVYRKLISELSPIVPVHRGTRIIEGVSAEELAGAILHDSCRKEWDDRFDSRRVFESFGWGCETGFTVLKGGFPFRDRGFYLARVMARPSPNMSTRSAVSNIGRSRSTGAGSNHGSGSLLRRSTGLSNAVSDGRRTNGTQPGAIFIVGASYSGESESISQFIPAKYNGYNLPIGRVFVDGWVLETLDPYDTREIDVTIPSTRCTRVVAVDLRGSMPTTMNGTVNVAMVRSLTALGNWVEKRLKERLVDGKPVPGGFGIAIPCTRLPGGTVLLRESQDDLEGLDRRGVAWSVRVRDGKRVLLKERFAVEERVYRCMMLVSVVSVLPNDKEKLAARSASRTKSPKSPSPAAREQRTERSPSDVLDVTRQDEFGERANNAGSATATPPSSAPSTIRGRPTTSPFRRYRGFRQPSDILAAELVIDSKMYPDGYDITIWSRRRPEEGKSIPLKDTTTRTSTLLDAVSNATTQTPTNRPQEQQIPLRCTVHTMPSSPMHSSGLAAEPPVRHLVKLSLPTAQYELQTVEDPLTGERRSPPEKPSWLLELEEGGSVVVEIEVRPNKPKSAFVRINGEEVSVENEKESLTSLGREELMNDRLVKMPVLTMVPNETEALPDLLRDPLAIADDLLDPTATKSSAGSDSTDSKPTEAADSTAESNGKIAGTQSLTSGNVVRGPASANHGGLLGFLQNYPNPLTRFAGGSVSTGGECHTTRGSSGTGMDSVTSPASSSGSNTTSQKVPGGFVDVHATTPTTPRRSSLKLIAIVALIAFLIGSLLRSLLSPADFIYVVKDLKEAEEARVAGGWREIRRLFEIKYVLGGWDFQIAAVRRH